MLDHVTAIAVDEYDECAAAYPEAMSLLLSAASTNAASGAKPQARPGPALRRCVPEGVF